MNKKLNSPQIQTFETDKSNRLSIASNLPNSSSGSGGVGGSNSSNGSTNNNNNNNNNNNDNYLLLETGFYLLQEDGSKILL